MSWLTYGVWKSSQLIRTAVLARLLPLILDRKKFTELIKELPPAGREGAG